MEKKMTKAEIAGMIDHTLLAAYAQRKDIRRLCKEAKAYHFASVCVNPNYVAYAKDHLTGTDVKVCTVIGFPLGSDTTSVKAFAAEDAVKNGADEIDMVINIASAKNQNFDRVEEDIKAVVAASKKAGKEKDRQVIVKVILETCYLTDEEVVNVCIAAKNAKADFVKTSTGFGSPKELDGTVLPNGASVHHVALMKKTVGDSMQIKAAGGIRSVRTAIDLINAGATRLGTSSGLLIVENWDNES